MEATPGLNRRIAVLQTAALPLGYVAKTNTKSIADKDNGAEDGIRTRDPRLGKAMLYR